MNKKKEIIRTIRNFKKDSEKWECENDIGR